MKMIKKSRKKGERILKIETSRDGEVSLLGGITVYLKPTGVKLDTEKHFQAWFMELPDSCAC